MSALVDVDGHVYELGHAHGTLLVPELAWLRDGDRVTLRDVIGALERYEPARSLTAAAVEAHLHDRELSCVTVASELARVLTSKIVLNAGLREAVLASGLSLSEIATRCGRLKHGRTGYAWGETSWLSRRVGLMREGGKAVPTPWVHTDVLGLIARDGLGVEPRLVELDVQQDVEIEEHWCPACAETVTTAPDGVCPWCESSCAETLAVAA